MKCTAGGMVKGAAAIALVAFPCAAVAHEKWFADAKGYPTQWEQIFRFPQIVGMLLALPVTIVLAVVWRRTGGRALLPGRRHSAPRQAAAHAFIGQLFSPDNPLSGPGLYGLGVVQIGIGLSVLYGGLARAAVQRCACSGSLALANPELARAFLHHSLRDWDDRSVSINVGRQKGV